MTNQKPVINLSAKSISDIIALCKTIQERNSTNEKSRNMATGISSFVQEKGFLSERQANWICRNADFYKVVRPAELMDFSVLNSAKSETQRDPDTARKESPDEKTDVATLAAVLRIESLLKERLV